MSDPGEQDPEFLDTEGAPGLFPRIVSATPQLYQYPYQLNTAQSDLESDDGQSIHKIRNLLFRPAGHNIDDTLPVITTGVRYPGGVAGEDAAAASIVTDDSNSVSNRNHTANLFPVTNSNIYRNEADISDGGYFHLLHHHSGSALSSREDAFSIHSSVVEQMDLGLETIRESKFNYLKAYEKKLASIKKLNGNTAGSTTRNATTVANDNESVFNLSKLDDFTKFVRLTEINDAISKKIAANLAANDNLANNTNDLNPSQLELNVVPAEGLREKYVGNFEDEECARAQKLKGWHLDWQKKTSAHNNNNNSKRKMDEQDESFYGTLTNNSIAPPTNSDDYMSTDSHTNHSNRPKYLQRKLKVRHLQMISFGGTLGVGLFLNSGKALNIAGGLGMLLAYVICGAIVLATMISFCEMVTFVSVVDGVSGLSSRFVDDSFGFAAGWLYFISFSVGLAAEIVASVIMLSYYPELKILESKGSRTGFVMCFMVIVFLSNLIDVRIFGEIEYISSFIKLLCCLIISIIMIVLNAGHFEGTKNIGFKYWLYDKSVFDQNLIFGPFRETFNLQDNGTNTGNIGGDLGRFLSFIVAMLVVSYAYSGTEIVCIAACEAQNPRKALPSATRRVFWRILIFYCLLAFVVSLNVYAGDPRLLRYYLGNTGVPDDQFASNIAINYVGGQKCYDKSIVYAGFGTGFQLPWIIALQLANLCKFSSIVNGFLVFFAVSCGNAQLYVSSRTVYSLALQNKAPKVLTYCNSYGIPYNAVLFLGSIALISFLCVNEQATKVFQNLTLIISSSGIFVWLAMNLSYIRFYYGLQKRPDIISRDDKAYPYKGLFQPYSAIFGFVGSTLIIFLMGFVVFLKGEWDTLFFFSSYGTLMIFAVLYFGHKFVKGTRIPSLETLDFDSGRREMDRYIWDGGREYNMRSIKDLTHKWISFLA